MKTKLDQPVTLSSAHRLALVAYLKDVEANDGLNFDFCESDPATVHSIVEALNLLDGGDRDPQDHA